MIFLFHGNIAKLRKNVTLRNWLLPHENTKKKHKKPIQTLPLFWRIRLTKSKQWFQILDLFYYPFNLFYVETEINHIFTLMALLCHKLFHLDKILSFLYGHAKNQIWKTENALSVQKLQRKGKISHNFSLQKTTCVRKMSRSIFLFLLVNKNLI